MTVLLFEFEKISIDDDGMIKFSRYVASVEFEGAPKVFVAVFWYDKDLDMIIMVGEDEEAFRPKKAGKSSGTLDVRFCKMDVTIAWSIMSLFP